MKSITCITGIALWIATSMFAIAQETNKVDESILERIEVLEEGKQEIIDEEKELLSKEIRAIEEALANGDITADKAEILKQKAAEKRALNIENKVAILDNKIELLERNGENYDSFNVKVKFNDRKIFSRDNGTPSHFKRTFSSTVVAFGLNNAIIDGQSLDDSPYRVGGSRFFEIGHVWSTRVLKNAGWFRVKYGISFQFNGLKPEGNKYVETASGTPVLEEYPLDLDKSKIRQDNLVIPLHLEFGPSKRVERDGKTYFNHHNNLKIGVGGYAGFNLNTIQKLKFNDNGQDVKEKTKLNGSANNFVYGLSGYIGWDNMSLYMKYDLNPIFKNGPEQRNVSAGVRFDFD